MPSTMIEPTKGEIPVVSRHGDFVEYVCPGCGWLHQINVDRDGPPSWSFNGDLVRPTLSPSINAWRDYPTGTQRCHHFVTDGKIQFLNDCTHERRGQTVPLPPWRDPSDRAAAALKGDEA